MGPDGYTRLEDADQQGVSLVEKLRRLAQATSEL
jgi:hypothetical protein